MAVPVYYTVLGLDPRASDDDIHAAFHRLAAQYMAADDAAHTLAARRFRMIKEAYAVLGNPVRRAAYDAQLSGARYAVQPTATVESVAGALPDEDPSKAAREAPANTVATRRRALWGWVRRHPAHSLAVAVLLLLLQYGALEQPRRSVSGLHATVSAVPVVPSISATLVAAVSPPTPIPTSTTAPTVTHATSVPATTSARTASRTPTARRASTRIADNTSKSPTPSIATGSPISTAPSATATGSAELQAATAVSTHSAVVTATPAVKRVATARRGVRVTPSVDTETPIVFPTMQHPTEKRPVQPRLVAALPVFPVDRVPAPARQRSRRDARYQIFRLDMNLDGRSPANGPRRPRFVARIDMMSGPARFYSRVAQVRLQAWTRRYAPDSAFGGHGSVRWLVGGARTSQV